MEKIINCPLCNEPFSKNGFPPHRNSIKRDPDGRIRCSGLRKWKKCQARLAAAAKAAEA